MRIKSNQSLRVSLCASLFAAGLGLMPLSARAAVYDVSINTNALVADAADQPYGLYFSLSSGGAPGASNTVTFSNFDFGGGAADDGESIDQAGGVSSNASLTSSITLDSSTGQAAAFGQNFTPGQTLTFQIDTTTDLADTSQNLNPDTLSIQISDDASATDSFNSEAIATQAPDGASFITFTYADPSLVVETYASDSTQETPGGDYLTIPAPSVAAVPDPSSAVVVLVSMGIGLCRRRRVK